MLKGKPEKITPVEFSEEQRENILRERESAPWHARAVARLRTRHILGALSSAFLVLLILSLLSFFQKDLRGTDALAEQGQTSQGAEAGSLNQPAPDEQTIQLSVVSTPREATVYLNGDSVGVTPLLGHAITTGEWILSIRKPHFVAFDTVLTFEDNVGLYFPLQEAQESLAEAGIMDDAALPEPALPSEAFLQPPSATSEELAHVAVEPEEEAHEIPVAAPSGSGGSELLLTTNPVGAEVWLDDQHMGATPLVLRTVAPGMRSLRFQMEGYAPYAAEFELHPLTELHRNLTALGSQVTIQMKPHGALYIDEERHTSIPDEEYVAYLSTGSHGIKAVHPDLGTWEQVVHVGGNSPQRVIIDFTTLQPPAMASANAGEEQTAKASETEAARIDSLEAQTQRQEQQYQYLAGQGDALFKEGNYEVARSRYEEMLAFKPDDGYALAMIAESKRLREDALTRQEPPEAPTSQESPEASTSQEPPEVIVEEEEKATSEEPPPTEGLDNLRPRANGVGTRDSGKAFSIAEVDGKRTLEVGQIENFRVRMGSNANTPPVFYWESEAGVFARGRSIDIQFVEAGVYTVTVTALNNNEVDRATFDITVTAPSVSQTSREVVRTGMQTAPRRSTKASRRETELSTQEPAFEHSALYNSKGVLWGEGGYTWVIATHLYQEAAESEMVRYRVAGYRSEVFEDTEGEGSTAYRLIIGQFPTREAALGARNQLPPDIPGGIWLLKLYTPPN